MTAATSTATVSGKTYRLTGSCIPAGPKFDGLRAAFRSLGIADYVNAKPPRCSVRHVQLFAMLDGSYQRASSSTVCAAARLARGGAQ